MICNMTLCLIILSAADASGNFTETLIETITFQTTSIRPTISQVAATSSQYTPEKEFAINEVIKLEIRSIVPHGLVDLEYHTS